MSGSSLEQAVEYTKRVSCERKQRWPPTPAAIAAAHQRARWLGTKENEPMAVYWCIFCKGYHIGHSARTTTKQRVMAYLWRLRGKARVYVAPPDPAPAKPSIYLRPDGTARGGRKRRRSQ